MLDMSNKNVPSSGVEKNPSSFAGDCLECSSFPGGENRLQID